jgi:inorganic pyrophosphatase
LAAPPVIEVFVEIPRGSRNKYEYDEQARQFRLDRVLYSSVHYPADYGFVPDTLAEDGDTLDALVLVEEPTFPGCIIPARPVGLLYMRDEKGSDAKVLAVPIGDPRFAGIHDLRDVPPHWLREIENFFSIYKQLEEKSTDMSGWSDAAEAHRVIAAARQAWRQRNSTDE